MNTKILILIICICRNIYIFALCVKDKICWEDNLFMYVATSHFGVVRSSSHLQKRIFHESFLFLSFLYFLLKMFAGWNLKWQPNANQPRREKYFPFPKTREKCNFAKMTGKNTECVWTNQHVLRGAIDRQMNSKLYTIYIDDVASWG